MREHEADTQQVIVQALRTGLWLPVIQTILWLVHGGRDGTFQQWSQSALGAEGLAGFWVLSLLWLFLAFLPLLVTISDSRWMRWLTFGFSLLFLLAAAMDWVGEQNSQAYQYPLKVAHTMLALILTRYCWRWARAAST